MRTWEATAKLAEFGSAVLEALDSFPEWDADMLDVIADKARRLGLAGCNDRSEFERAILEIDREE